MTDPAKDGERIAKRLARAGLCSRRDAERWIEAGRVKVDGTVLSSPAFNVTAESLIEVDGKPLPQADRARLWRYHKPPGEMVTARDPEGRRTIFDSLPKGMPRVAVEAGVTDFWRKYVGLEGAVIGIDRYGESAPAGELYKYFGITTEAVAAAVKQVLSQE